MRKHLTIANILAIVAYAAAAGLAVVYESTTIWVVAICCAIMFAIPHPSGSHLACSVSLILMVLVDAGRIEWMSEFVPALGIVIGLVGSTKMVNESRKPHPVPKWESNGYDDRVNAGMVFVGDGDD